MLSAPQLRRSYRLKESESISTTVFSTVHGPLGILDQRFLICAVFGENTDADATAGTERTTVYQEFRGRKLLFVSIPFVFRRGAAVLSIDTRCGDAWLGP